MEAVDTLTGAMESVIGEIRSKFQESSKHAGIIDSLRAFAAAVDWKEPWLVGLLSAEALLLLLVLGLRKNQTLQGVVFLSSACIVYMAEHINTFLARHHTRFAGQPYFDKHGIFTSAVISAPLVFIMFVQLVNYLVLTSQLLIDMKRKELLFKARQRAKAEGGQRQKGSKKAD